MVYIEVEFTIEPLFPARDILVSELADIGFESFVETPAGVQAYVTKNEFSAPTIEALSVMNNTEFQLKYTAKEIADQNWNEVWESNFDPITIGEKCEIRAPFHPENPNVQLEVLIAPKMSFGTGHHETTYQMVERLFDLELENQQVLDMGCGTGILAIVAEKLGAKQIKGIDIDDWSVENTHENIALNECENIEVLQGDVALLGTESFDVVLANINKNVLLADIPKYAEVLHTGGALLLSGFFDVDVADVLAVCEQNGLSHVQTNSKNTWAMLHVKKIK